MRGTNMRELISTYPYIIRYFIDGDTVVILRVRHTSRRPTNPDGSEASPRLSWASAIRAGAEPVDPGQIATAGMVGRCRHYQTSLPTGGPQSTSPG